MNELALELKKDCGRKPRKSREKAVSRLNSGNSESSQLYVCPSCGLEDTDPERHRNHVQECNEDHSVRNLPRENISSRARETYFSESDQK